MTVNDNVFIPELKMLANCIKLKTGADNGEGLEDAVYSVISGNCEMDCHIGFPIERLPAVELRSEMLEQLALKICSLIKEEGYRPSDIVILSTYADIVTELAIGGILKANGIKLLNTGSWQNASDSSLCWAILAFTRLCHPGLRLFPDKRSISHIMQVLFGLDPVRSGKIARKICSTFPFPEMPELETIKDSSSALDGIKEKYERLRAWIADYKAKDKPLEIGAFLQLALMEIFLDTAQAPEEIRKAKHLADAALKFSKTMAGFGRNTARDFIEMAVSLLKEEKKFLEDGVDEDVVRLTTPDYFAANPVYNKVLIISGLSSRHWIRGTTSEFANPRVLSTAWQRGMKYTDDIKAEEDRKYLTAMLSSIFRKRGGKVITFESMLSENGFENDGALPEIMDKLTFHE